MWAKVYALKAVDKQRVAVGAADILVPVSPHFESADGCEDHKLEHQLLAEASHSAFLRFEVRWQMGICMAKILSDPGRDSEDPFTSKPTQAVSHGTVCPS